MRVVGLVGRSGSGKTTLIEALLPLLLRRGLRVSTVKHSHKPLVLDQPGKDSFRHRATGAHETLVAGAGGWALHGGEPGRTPALADLLARLDPVDLVLVEGFRAEVVPRIELCRAARLDEPHGEPLWRDDPGISAVITDAPARMRGLGWHGEMLPLGDPDRLVAWLLGHGTQVNTTCG